jgi:hypothetical protein
MGFGDAALDPENLRAGASSLMTERVYVRRHSPQLLRRQVHTPHRRHRRRPSAWLEDSIPDNPHNRRVAPVTVEPRPAGKRWREAADSLGAVARETRCPADSAVEHAVAERYQGGRNRVRRRLRGRRGLLRPRGTQSRDGYKQSRAERGTKCGDLSGS